MQNSYFKFFQKSFQSSNFTFVHFNTLSFIFIQLRVFLSIFIKNFWKKNLENTFQSLIEYFQFKNFEEIKNLTTTYNKNRWKNFNRINLKVRGLNE